jgi:hypothetical protein
LTQGVGAHFAPIAGRLHCHCADVIFG